MLNIFRNSYHMRLLMSYPELNEIKSYVAFCCFMFCFELIYLRLLFCRKDVFFFLSRMHQLRFLPELVFGRKDTNTKSLYFSRH